jgi:bacillithiol biosynthesis cysteine-adding enzyme BshC
MIPFGRYPGVSPLFLDFQAGLPEFFPDRPTPEAAAARGRELLAGGRPARVPASAFRHRGAEAARMANELAAGRAVAVAAGHQVGLFTGPLFTLVKALDAIHLARELSRRGVPAVPVFWALTDDHDLQEIARTARPGSDGPEYLILEGADRQNRRAVGRLPIPEGIRAIVDAFRPDAQTPEASAVLESFAGRSAAGTSYGDAFIETLLDLVAPEPLLVLDPLGQALREPTVEFFLEASRRAGELRTVLSATEDRLRRAGKDVPAPVPGGFSFFTIDAEGRSRVEDLAEASRRVAAGQAWPSADVLTRPVLKSWLFPMAASVLGSAEIAYHAQSLPIFELFDVAAPVLIPRTHVVLRGPTERRLAEALGVAEENLLRLPPAEPVEVPGALELAALERETADRLAALAPRLENVDPSLAGALETARRKIAYQLEQLTERTRKAAERRDDVAAGRRRRLENALLPGGVPAERVYPPLSPMLAWGNELRGALEAAVGRHAEGAAVVDLGIEPAGTTQPGAMKGDTHGR